MTIKRYDTAREYLDDDTITSANQIAWHTLESEELSNGMTVYDHLEDVPESDPRTFMFMRRNLGLTSHEAVKVLNLWELDKKFPE
jgi:hypothetical protein